MPTPLVVLFYAWLLASVVILVHRRLTKRRLRTPVVRAEATDRALRTDWSAPPAPADAGGAPPPGPLATTPPPAPTEPIEPIEPIAGPSPAGAAPHPPGPNGEPPADPVGSTGDAATAGPPAATLMEALAGISMPCDLLPLTSVEGRLLGDRELLLVTSGRAPEEVVAAFDAALGALGYAVTSMGPVTTLATRGPDRITVVLHERPYDELSGKRPAFPTTKPGDVVLELRL